MKKFGTVLFAWWFLAYSSGNPPVKIGPFKEKETCDKIAEQTKKYPELNSFTHAIFGASSCWED